MASILAFSSGDVSVNSPGIGLKPRTILSFTAGEVAVEAPTINLSLTRRLTLRPGNINVTGFDFSLFDPNLKLQFLPGEVQVSAPGISLAPRARGVFPSLRPSRRRFVPPAYSVTKATTESGASSRRLWGSAGADALLELVYEHVDDVVAETFMQVHDNALGGYLPLAISPEVFGGVGELMKTFMGLAADALEWHFEKPPVVQSVQLGVATVTVSLIGRNVAKFNALTPGVFNECPIVENEDGAIIADIEDVRDDICEPDFVPHTCGETNGRSSWIAFHSITANAMDKYSEYLSQGYGAGDSHPGGVCFDEEGNVYSMIKGGCGPSDRRGGEGYLSFAKLNNNGEQQWEITHRHITGQSVTLTSGEAGTGDWGGGLLDFSPTHVIGNIYSARRSTQYLFLVPKDGDVSKFKIYNLNQLAVGNITVTAWGSQFIFGTANRLAAYRVRSDLSLELLWAKQYGYGTVFPGSTSGNTAAVNITCDPTRNRLYLCQYAKIIAFDLEGNYVWHRALFVDVTSFNLNTNSITTDPNGNVYTGYTPRVGGNLIPWIVKLDYNGNFLNGITYWEGPYDNYVFLWFLKATTDGRLIAAGEGGIESVFGCRFAIFTDELEYERSFGTFPVEFDVLEYLSFSDQYGAQNGCIDWCDKTKEFVWSGWAQKGANMLYYTFDFNDGYPPEHCVIFKHRIDDEELTCSYTHPTLADLNWPAVTLPLVGVATPRENLGSAVVPVTNFTTPSWVYSGNLTVSGNAVSIGTETSPSFGSYAEVWYNRPNPWEWYWYSTLPTYSLGVVSEDENGYQIFSYSTSFPNPADITEDLSTLPLYAIEYQEKPVPYEFNPLPVAVAFRSVGTSKKSPGDDFVLCQLSVDRPDFKFQCDKTGATIQGNPQHVYLENKDYRANRYGLLGYCYLEHKRFNTFPFYECTIEVDIYYDPTIPPVNTTTSQFLLQVGSTYITASDFNEGLLLTCYNNFTYTGGYGQGALPPNKWVTVSITLRNEKTRFRWTGDFDKCSKPAFGYAWDHNTETANKMLRHAWSQGVNILPSVHLGGSSSGTNLVNSVYFSNFRLSAKALYVTPPRHPYFDGWPEVTRVDETMSQTLWRMAAAAKRVPRPVPPPENVISTLLFDGPEGSSVFTDEGDLCTWTSTGGTITNFYGDTCLNCFTGGVECVNVPYVTSKSFFVEFFFYRSDSTDGDDPLGSPAIGAGSMQNDDVFCRWVGRGLILIGEDYNWNQEARQQMVILGSRRYNTMPWKNLERHHLAIQVDEDFKVRIYLDGYSIEEFDDLCRRPPSWRNHINNPAGDTFIWGAFQYYTAQYFKGYIFEGRFGIGELYKENFVPPTTFRHDGKPAYTPPPVIGIGDTFNWSHVLMQARPTQEYTTYVYNEVPNPVSPYPLRFYCKFIWQNSGDFGVWNSIAPQGVGSLSTPVLPVNRWDPLTVEFFARVNANLTSKCIVALSFCTLIYNSTNLYFRNGSNNGSTLTSISTGIIYHFAIVKTSGSVLTLYVNGVNVGTQITSYSEQINVLFARDNSGNNQFGTENIHYGPIRISRYPVYTSNFTPPPLNNPWEVGSV